MKILAFNASPRKDQSITDFIMKYFLDSAIEVGADVEKHFLTDLDIKGCIGCFSCWFKTPGKCIHRDDMDWILPKINDANVLILGTPIYHYNIIHYLQRMRERTLPLDLPEMIISDGETHHPGRYKSKRQHTVLVAVCGFPDSSNFRQASLLFPNSVYIFLPASGIIHDRQAKTIIQPFIEAVKKAGREIVEHGDISEETKQSLVVDFSQEGKESIVNRTNEVFEKYLKKD